MRVEKLYLRCMTLSLNYRAQFMRQNIQISYQRIRIAICLLLLAAVEGSLYAQQRNVIKEFDVDSTLYTYYERCKEELGSPLVLQMADTLYHMAEAKQDTRMQAVALSTRLDYYYYLNETDSIMHYVDVVMQFAQKTHQPKYYYFAWGKRKIAFYVKHQRLHLALYEVEQLIKQAEQEQYASGIASGYNILSAIYEQKGLYKLAAESRKQEIQTLTENHIDDFNISGSYNSMSVYYSRSGEFDKAEEALQKAYENLITPMQTYYYWLRRAELGCRKQDFHQAKACLDEAKHLLDTEKQVQKVARNYYELLVQYYTLTDQYPKALEAYNQLEEILKAPTRDPRHLSALAKIYQHLGNNPRAIECYENYIKLSDSIRTSQADIAVGEFSALLDVSRLNTEKLNLQEQIHQKDIRNNRFIIVSLLLILTFILVFLHRERLLNKRLKRSQKELSEKHEALLQSEKMLLQEKERAEQASIMKSEFIQNMTHEIRTPLNAIVGFSQILTQMSQENEEAAEYASIIEQGSNNLLRLVEDVLDISHLDSTGDLPADTYAEANSLCHICVEQIRPLAAPGVEMHVETPSEETYLYTSTIWLTKTLHILLQNASKFTHKGSITLALHTDTTQERLYFIVTDTGIGIPTAQKEHIFERFTKLNSFVQGTGLGLPIGRLCAAKMGGSLTLDTTYTHGCRFVLALPWQKHPVPTPSTNE